MIRFEPATPMKTPATKAAPTGTQLIDRGTALLRRIAQRGQGGGALTDLARRCEIDKGTAHRILAGLVRQRLVVQDPVTRAYRLGPLLFELGLGRNDLHAFQRACEKPLDQLAQRLGCMSYVYLRSGTDVVIAAQSGRKSVKALMGHIGTRRPMLLTAGGAAMLMGMPQDEAEAIILENVAELESTGSSPRAEAGLRILERSRQLGYGLSEGHIAPHTTVAAVALRERGGRVFAALNAGGPTDQFPADEMPRVELALRETGALLEEAAAQCLKSGLS